MRRIPAIAALLSIALQIGGYARASAADDVIFKIYNDSKVPMTAIYDKPSSQKNWGVNDLADMNATADPYNAPVRPVAPGHFFYIRLAQNGYSHCPGILLDVKIVFANGHVKQDSGIDVCKYDLHVSRA
jgi:hypothetical protein